MKERDAWRLFHKQERAAAEYKARLQSIRLELERLELDMHQALVKQYSEDKGFLRAVKRFTGCTPYGWSVACGPDGRVAGLVRLYGWPQLFQLIKDVRKIKGANL